MLEREIYSTGSAYRCISSLEHQESIHFLVCPIRCPFSTVSSFRLMSGFQIFCHLFLMISLIYFCESSLEICSIGGVSVVFVANEARSSATSFPLIPECPVGASTQQWFVRHIQTIFYTNYYCSRTRITYNSRFESVQVHIAQMVLFRAVL